MGFGIVFVNSSVLSTRTSVTMGSASCRVSPALSSLPTRSRPKSAIKTCFECDCVFNALGKPHTVLSLRTCDTLQSAELNDRDTALMNSQVLPSCSSLPTQPNTDQAQECNQEMV